MSKTIRYGITLPEKLWLAVRARVERYRGSPQHMTINTFFARALEYELTRTQDDHRDKPSGHRAAASRKETLRKQQAEKK